MKHIEVTRLLCVIALSMIVGCTVSVNVNNETDTDMGTHHVVIKPGSAFTTSASITGGTEETHTFTCGDVNVKIENEVLIVNDKNYGSLQAGQSIEIDHGKVYVATQERKEVTAKEQ